MQQEKKKQQPKPQMFFIGSSDGFSLFIFHNDGVSM